ncbi:MAG: SPASM domain-containing protein, partial [Clostridia bacterium]|nr:SPASM domain-containing protein [Clostridia bacterium]
EARANVRQFARQSRINQVDLIDLAERIGTAESKTLANALRGCVVNNNTTISRAYGVSIYFPYESLSGMKSAVSTYNSLGIDSEYTKCIQSFASLEQGGQFASSASQYGYGSYSSGGDLLSQLLGGFMDSSTGASGSSPYDASSPLGSLLGSYTNDSGSYSAGNTVDASTIYDLLSAFSGRSMPASLDWVDTGLVASKALEVAQNRLDPSRITVTEKNGQRALVLSDAEWALIDTAALNLFVDDGQGFIDLGYDNYLVFDNDDDLLLGFEGTWLCLDGNPAAFYMTSAEEEGTYGRVTDRLRLLQAHRVDTNLLCVVNGRTAKSPARVYRALKGLGTGYIQFIPCLDPLGVPRGSMKWSLTPEAYGQFLCGVFDEWYRDWAAGRYVSVRLFDDFVYSAMGLEPGTCSSCGRCGYYLVAEADGSLYPCDFYVLDEWKLGMPEEGLEALSQSETMRAFRARGERKPARCLTCPDYPICRGGCPRDWTQEDGRIENYYCPAFRHFFAYARERIYRIAQAERRLRQR